MDRDELLDRIAAGPADQEVELLRVYADQLIERGDPHGELIVVATQRLALDTPELSRREDALLAQHNALLATQLDRPTSTSYRWRRGFVDAVEFNHHGEEQLAPVLGRLAGAPVARLLRRLRIDAVELDGQGDLGPVFAELARLAPRFPRLVEIVVVEGMNVGNPWIDGPIALHDVSPLYAAFPKLEILELDGTTVELHEIHLPSVRRFVATHLRTEDARRIVSAHLPCIADLELAFSYGQDNIAATFGPLLHRDFGPQLERLSLALPSRDAMHWLIAQLPGCPLARHVRRLAFRHTRLDEAFHESLIVHAKQLAGLDQLELPARAVSAGLQKRLRKAYGHALVLL